VGIRFAGRRPGRLSFAVGAAVALGASATVALAVSTTSPFAKPAPGVLTVASLPPGADYKSLPAEPERVDPTNALPMSLAEARAVIDPRDDPDILVCQRRDGTFTSVFIDRVQDGVEVRTTPPPSGRLDKDPLAGMVDNGPCNEE
jgi:hypothetical protein